MSRDVCFFSVVFYSNSGIVRHYLQTYVFLETFTAFCAFLLGSDGSREMTGDKGEEWRTCNKDPQLDLN